MAEDSHSAETALAEECRVFCLYLTGIETGEYIRHKYVEAHQTVESLKRMKAARFDRFIVRFATSSTFCTRLADVFTRWFFKRSVLRPKLILAMAIMECAGQTYAHFESGTIRNRAWFWLWMAMRACGFAFCLVLSLVLIPTAFALTLPLPGNERNSRRVQV